MLALWRTDCFSCRDISRRERAIVGSSYFLGLAAEIRAVVNLFRACSYRALFALSSAFGLAGRLRVPLTDLLAAILCVALMARSFARGTMSLVPPR
jgi:sulfite exporter TauE/SafE